MVMLLLLLLGLSYTHAVQYNAVPDSDAPQKDFDGVGIGLVSRPKVCEKTTKRGDLLRVNFNASIGDGTVFETRYMTEPLEFVIGEGAVIGGFEVGLQDMCLNEIRHLTVPTKYAYGTNGLGNLPSRVTLYFFVKLLSFETVPNAPHKPNIFKDIDTNVDLLLSPDEVHKYLKKVGVKDQQGDHGIKQMMRDIFKEEDRDSNGYIGHAEFSGRKMDEL